ncbi:MAG TPA: YkgJ family cysteine cluster protein [Steroidobacteraceae bacterium]|nr:YkgJ family cysteine cluster protein [Steroidobacteraceae bacterium]
MPAAPLPAGDFSDWLRAMRRALAGEGEMDVACGDCRGCCVSSYYVKVRDREADAIASIGASIGDRGLEPGPAGSRLMGFHANGHCLMLRDGNCSIYQHRPETCRTYDCRVFTAAGMNAGPDKPVINERVARWEFNFPTDGDREEQRAVAAAATFLRQHPVRFPGGHVPSRPSEVAVLAIKAYEVFLDSPDNDAELRTALIDAVTGFERAAQRGV